MAYRRRTEDGGIKQVQAVPQGEDQAVFDDLLTQCKLYAAEAGVLASLVKEVPLLLSMIFAQHKKLAELERRVNELLR